MVERSSPRILNNVVVIRPILIVLLVFYHAFLIFQGGWGSAGQFPEIKVYWWLDKLSYSFLLETFVFISGYVLGYQVRMKGKSILSPKSFFWKKIKRLIIPSIVFSFLYIILLGDISQPILKTLNSIVNGVGHMWFLPMLFWCFTLVWLIETLNLSPRVVLPILLPCSICSFIPIPLRIGVSMYYMLFFYVGYCLQRLDISLDRYYSLRWIIGLVLSFIILFFSFTYVQENLDVIFGEVANRVKNQLLFKAFKISLINVTKIIYSSVGIAMLLCIVGQVDKKQADLPPQWLINVGGLCMGVYLFQQFILKGLYFHTDLALSIDPIWLPWVGFVIALAGSLLLSFIFRKTRIGRFLIG